MSQHFKHREDRLVKEENESKFSEKIKQELVDTLEHMFADILTIQHDFDCII